MSGDTLEFIFYPVILELTLALALLLVNIVDSAISSGIFLVDQLQLDNFYSTRYPFIRGGHMFHGTTFAKHCYVSPAVGIKINSNIIILRMLHNPLGPEILKDMIHTAHQRT